MKEPGRWAWSRVVIVEKFKRVAGVPKHLVRHTSLRCPLFRFSALSALIAGALCDVRDNVGEELDSCRDDQDT